MTDETPPETGETPADATRTPSHTTHLAAEHLEQFNKAFSAPRRNTDQWDTNHADTAF